MDSIAFADLLRIHFSIPAVLLLHGVAITVVFHNKLPISRFQDPLVGILLLGFAASILFNCLVAVILSLLSLPLSGTLLVIGIFDMLLLAVLLLTRPAVFSILKDSSRAIWVLMAILTILMLDNGGVIESMADSWWHMSYVNQILDAETIFLERHHLTGQQIPLLGFPYEPGWHIQLALISRLSGSPLPLIWYSLGLWCAALTVLAYYYFSHVLINNRTIALTSAVLFIITLGGINAYLRVSPWPGNVSFIIFYQCLALIFIGMNGEQFRATTRLDRWFPMARFRQLFYSQRPLIILIALLLTLLAFLHMAEGLWLVTALAFYSFFLSIAGICKNSHIENDRRMLESFWIWFFVSWTILAAYRMPDFSKDLLFTMCGLLLIHFFACRVFRQGNKNHQMLKKVVFISGIATVLFLLVDFNHVWHLLRPVDASSLTGENYIPDFTKSRFGTWLMLPKWEHQLRAGLLFSGVAGIVASIILLFYQRSRGTVFLAACALFAFFIITSPYLFTYFAAMVNLAATYRFQVLIFHPIILAYCIYILVRKSSGRPL